MTTDNQEVERYYQIQAKQTVDWLFEAKYFHPDITRDGMQAVEDFLAFMFQSQCRAAVRGADKVIEKLKKLGEIK